MASQSHHNRLSYNHIKDMDHDDSNVSAAAIAIYNHTIEYLNPAYAEFDKNPEKGSKEDKHLSSILRDHNKLKRAYKESKRAYLGRSFNING